MPDINDVLGMWADGIQEPHDEPIDTDTPLNEDWMEVVRKIYELSNIPFDKDNILLLGYGEDIMENLLFIQHIDTGNVDILDLGNKMLLIDIVPIGISGHNDHHSSEYEIEFTSSQRCNLNEGDDAQ